MNQQGETVGKPTSGAAGIEKTTAQIMQEQSDAPVGYRAPRFMPEREGPERDFLPQDPNAPAVASTGAGKTTSVRGRNTATAPSAPQTVGTSFTGATLNDTHAFPPDSMGAVGPTQFVVFVNGRLRTFNKTTGVADGVINADPDVFFASVLTPVPPAGVNFTSDPQVRYDRLSGRWFLLIIDVPSSTSATIGDTPNRILLAVSDAASNGTISAGTVWTYYFVQQDTLGGIPSSGEFLDYPSLGVDANALYVGGNMFSATAGTFTGTNAYVIRKSSVLSGGPVVATAFRGLTNGSTEGPYAPRGVDNYDPAATEGYFIGVSVISFGRLDLRRVSTPGATPTLSANILVTVSATSNPILVPHVGNTGGNNGRLDALDDRLYAAHIRNGRLWTAHNIAVNTTGVAATTGTVRRDGVRWYELVVPVGSGTPTVNQSGTIFDPAATASNPRHYWIPSVTVSGQGHAAFGFSSAGLADNPGAGTSGRLSGDTLGTTGTVALYNAAAGAYNPASDTGGTSGRRWGDYSFTSVDPSDDMTMWTIQEFCDAANSYGVRIAKLIAPAPATPASASPSSVTGGLASTSVTITGTQVSGSGFFDPGANPPAGPAYNHITATVNGAGAPTVTSVTYTDPTHITLNLNTTAAQAGSYTVTVTNPDGQTATSASPIITVPGATCTPVSHIKVSDFDGDGKSDVAVWQGASTHNWVYTQSSNNSTQTHLDWGSTALGDVAVPGDYDGDGKTDFAVWRASEGNWYIVRSSNNSILTQQWGANGDVPVAGDYDGDGKTDFAVFRPSEGNWYIKKSSGGATIQGWGASSDKVVPGDYDNDGKTDIAVFRPSEGNWYVIKSTGGVLIRNWGAATDKLVPADYDGDGKTDFAVYRGGDWYIINSCAGTAIVKNWGGASDMPVPADYDGDGKADIAVYRPSEGNWYIIKSGNSASALLNLGAASDKPVPNAYLP